MMKQGITDLPVQGGAGDGVNGWFRFGVWQAQHRHVLPAQRSCLLWAIPMPHFCPWNLDIETYAAL